MPAPAVQTVVARSTVPSVEEAVADSSFATRRACAAPPTWRHHRCTALAGEAEVRRARRAEAAAAAVC